MRSGPPPNVLAATVLALVLSGCGSLSADEVERVATDFAASGSDPGARCGLLAPGARAALVAEESTSCEEAVVQVPVSTGEVTSVQVWGQEAQVRLADDTLFLTRTSDGWRISAAACEGGGEDRPYDCRLAAS
jgi:hypothetical protein